ncbi:MAG: hypothetical protein WC196_06815 [Bacilli bacterium]
MIPKIIRWFLVTATLILLTAGGVYAYQALTGQGQVTVIENLSWVGDSTFEVSLYPQESTTETLTLANASSVSMDVDIINTITPDPGTKGMTITVPNKVTVPASGQVSFDITITAGKSAEPVTYTITFGVER